MMEIADAVIKCKEKAQRLNISIRIAMAKLWYPRGQDQHVKALTIARLNLAIDVLCFYWLRCRSIGLDKVTMEPIKEGMEHLVEPEDTVGIRGYETEKFHPRNYRDSVKFPMEISYYPARRARETMRLIFKSHDVEPDWITARNNPDPPLEN